MSVWKASVNDVQELPSQVSFHVSVPWGVVLYDFSLVVSLVLWLWVVCELVFVATLFNQFLVRWKASSKTFWLDEMLVSCLLLLSGMFFSSVGGWLLSRWTSRILLGFMNGLKGLCCLRYVC